MRYLAIVGLLLGGCLESNFDECAGWACAAGQTCVVVEGIPACATRDQLQSCTGMASLAACPLPDGTGVCVDSVCVPARCGNGRLELSEQCDDGNTAAGDGCSPECTTETCGNGIIDVGESCDCGADGTPARPECNAHVNSDSDPLAPCRTNCTLRSCGDGILDPSEQCDGTSSVAATCGTFGYYGGSLTCSPICTFDTASCEAFGRCGDGVLQPVEFCDASAGVTVPGDCADYGQSSGELGCSAACGPDFAACRPPAVFTLILAANDLVDLVAGAPGEAWVGRSHEVVRYHDHTMLDHYPITPKVLDLTSASGDVLVSTADGNVLRFNATGMVETIVAPFPCIQIVAVTPTRFACLGDPNAAWWDTGVWGPAISGTNAGPASDATLLVATGEVMFTDYDGSTWDVNGGIYRLGPTSFAPMGGPSLDAVQLDHVADGYWGGVAYGGTMYGYDQIHLADSGAGLWQQQPTLGTSFVAQVGPIRFEARGTEVAVVGATPATRRTTGAIDGVNTSCQRLIAIGIEAVCMTHAPAGSIMRFAGASLGQPQQVAQIPIGAVADAFIDTNDAAFFIGQSPGGSRWPQNTIWSPPSGTAYGQMFARSSTAIVLVEKAPIPTKFAYWNGAWTEAVATAKITAAAADGQGNIALSVGNGMCQIARGPPTALVSGLILSWCPTSLWFSPTGVLWGASPSHLENFDLAIATQIPASPVASVAVISGLDDSHIWVAANDSIWFFDGTAWARQLQKPGLLFDWVSAGDGRAIATAGSATWILDSNNRWVKMHLPSDPTPLVHPMLRPWGVWFRTAAGTVEYAVWEPGWPG